LLVNSNNFGNILISDLFCAKFVKTEKYKLQYIQLPSKMKHKKIIKSFSIKGLFGTTDVKIPFDENVKILIGENGMGKTQILDILYYTLSRNFVRLNDYNFEEIVLEFEEKSIYITKKALTSVVNTININPLLKSIINLIGVSELVKLKNEISHNQLSRRDFRQYYLYDKITTQFAIDDVYDAILLNIDAINTLFDFDKIIDNQELSHLLGNKNELLYFATFRQLKEYFRWYNTEHYTHLAFEKNVTIDFSMEDVQLKFAEIEIQLNRFLSEGFANISSEILSQLASGELPEMENDFLKKINKKDLEIIFARAGDKIKAEQKNKIKQIVAEGEIREKDKFLLYFLQKLLNIYEQQRELDDSIKVFREVCNKYLYNKKVIYEESKIEIYIQSDESGEKLPLSKLSSGEKQIISIFAKIYLSPPGCNFIVLFDEPELSLSIFWQRNLLPDIYNSGKCPFLFAVTHSPFIFENDLDKYAVALSQYLTPSNLVLA
jgi:predicted ATP-binding protein involved in virulence